MDEQSKIKSLILKGVYFVIIVLIIAVIALLILKYQVEGEQNMPFKLSSIIVISNAEGYQEKENKEYKWDVQIYQNNDIYLNIEKNKNYKDVDAIKSIVIDNIQIDKKPQIGTIELYRPSEEGTMPFRYLDEYKITDSIEFQGDTQSDIKNLKISNQGSTLILRVLNKTGKNYTSNDETMEHNGRLLNKVDISYEEIKAKISFDLTLYLESDISYKTNIELELPVGNIIQEGSSNQEITDTRKIVFKRK